MFKLISQIFSLCFFVCRLCFAGDELIVWNVGQGQWVTEVHDSDCFHYDIGGEKAPFAEVLKLCGQKKNFLHFSHWDWDHISFAAAFARQVPRACLLKRPAGEASFFKLHSVEKIPLCHGSDVPKDYQMIFETHPATTSNETSAVIYSREFHALMPGDSPHSQEKIWGSRAIVFPITGLVLGHHGSRTSTSANLLKDLPHLQWAVASARKARYGHPHREVIELLQKTHIPLLKTEDWGHLHFLKGADVMKAPDFLESQKQNPDP